MTAVEEEADSDGGSCSRRWRVSEVNLVGHVVSCIVVGVRGRGGVDEVAAVSDGVGSAIKLGSR